MNGTLDHITGHTWHGRKGAISNAFRYSVDFVLLEPDAPCEGPSLFSHNRFNLFSVRDADHGGRPNAGKGSAWIKDILKTLKPPISWGKIELLTQPRLFGYVFNPVSFWLCYDTENVLRLVVSEVSNTFGDRHSYLCHHDDFSAIDSSKPLEARKVFHVSPFQEVDGSYQFRFDITPDRIGIWIDLTREGGGVIATLTGPRRKMSNASLLYSCIRRPLGTRRVMALIHWQAAKLWWKGAAYKKRPLPPEAEISR